MCLIELRLEEICGLDTKTEHKFYMSCHFKKTNNKNSESRGKYFVTFCFYKTKCATIIRRIPQVQYLLIFSSVVVCSQRRLFKAEKSSKSYNWVSLYNLIVQDDDKHCCKMHTQFSNS